MNTPITQSKAWQKLQSDLGEKSFFKQENTYHYLAILKHTPVGKYLYCPYGPIAKDRAGFQEAIKSLETLGKEQGAIFIRVEPPELKMAEYLPKTAQKSKDLNPKETWLLDLTGDDEALKAKLPSRLLRYHKSASKKGLTIETSHNPDDIRYLLDLQKALAQEKGISTFSENYLKTELAQPFATLYLVKYCNELPENVHSRPLSDNGSEKSAAPPITMGRRKRVENEAFSATSQAQTEADSVYPKVVAAGLVFDDKDTRYNLQGAQSDEGRKFHATGILTIQLILDAKQKGLKTFDFWGIAPEGAPESHPWAGFTAFKKTFTGYQYDHAGTYDIPLRPTKYRLYKSTRKLGRIIKK